MAKGMYIGVNGKARKAKKIYVGVSGKARKVKKAYIGVGGVARPFWTGGEVAYYGTIDPFSPVRSYSCGASNSNYAIFAGGRDINTNNPIATVEAYDKTLIKTSAPSLDEGLQDMVGGYIGDYAFFIGGQLSWGGGTSQGYAYSKTLVRSKINTVTSFLTSAASSGCSTIGNNMIIATCGNDSSENYIDIINTSLVHSTGDALDYGALHFIGTNVGQYALIANNGSNEHPAGYTMVYAYTSSLVRTTLPSNTLSKNRTYMQTANVGNYALFAGGNPSTTRTTVEVINSSLVAVTAPSLSQKSYSILHNNKGLSVGDNALFQIRSNSTTDTNPIDIYSTSLVRTTTVEKIKESSCNAVIGDNAIFVDHNGSVVSVFTV